MAVIQITGSATASAQNAQLSLVMPLAYPGNVVPPASYATITIANTTTETLTTITFQSTLVLAGVGVPLTYAQSLTLAPGATTTVTLTLAAGLAPNPLCIGTFNAPPTGGSLAVVVALSDLTNGQPTWIDDQITVNTTPAALPAAAGTQWLLTNDPTNPAGATIWMGSNTGQHTPLSRGSALVVVVPNLSVVWAMASQTGCLLDILGGV